MKNNLLYLVSGGLILVALLSLTDPFMVLMPTMTQMVVLVFLVCALAIWGGFVLTESAVDEREREHRLHAGRFAYLVGLGILTLALLLQGLTHSIDPWIEGALGAMVLTKLVTRIFENNYR